MKCRVGYENFFYEFPSWLWKHGIRQQGWCTSGALRKQFQKLTVKCHLKFIWNMFHAFVSFNLKTDKRSKITNTNQFRLPLVSFAHFNLNWANCCLVVAKANLKTTRDVISLSFISCVDQLLLMKKHIFLKSDSVHFIAATHILTPIHHTQIHL